MSALTRRMVRTARRRLGMTQAALAALTRVPISRLQAWERTPDATSHRSPPSDWLAELLVRSGMLKKGGD